MKRFLLLAMVGVIALLLAAPVQAQGRRNSVKGTAVLGSKDLRAQTIEVGRALFVVTPETLLQDREGNLITLADIPVPEVGSEERGDWALIGAEFLAKRIGDQNVLIKLSLTDPPT